MNTRSRQIAKACAQSIHDILIRVNTGKYDWWASGRDLLGILRTGQTICSEGRFYDDIP